jgi:hypothetical protein
VSYQRKTSPMADHARREDLLRLLRQVSRETAERFPRVTKRVAKLNTFMARRMLELKTTDQLTFFVSSLD